MNEVSGQVLVSTQGHPKASTAVGGRQPTTTFLFALLSYLLPPSSSLFFVSHYFK
jgi:hypothetical protein